MAKVRRKYLVVGLGQFGYQVARSLSEAGENVVALDVDLNRVQQVASELTRVINASGSDARTLRDLGLNDVDVAVVSCGQSIEQSILCTTVLHELGIRHIVAKAINETHHRILERVGATRVVEPEREVARQLAESFLHPDILEHIRLARDHSIIEIAVPTRLVGETLVSANLRARFNVNVVAISAAAQGSPDDHQNRQFNVSPSPDYKLAKGDILVIIGRNDQLETFKRTMER
mgnify:CR=1 FL=1